MISQPDGPFINLSKINFSKYAQRPTLSKVVYEIIKTIINKGPVFL